MTRRTTRVLTLAAAASLLAAACGSDGDTSAEVTTTASDQTTAEETASENAGSSTTMDAEMEMELPEYAADMKLEVSSASASSVLTANELVIDVAATGYALTCSGAGKPVQEGEGHYHLLLDGSLIDMECNSTATVSMQNVKPGEHTLTVVPAINDHFEVHDNAQELTFDYQPSEPLAEITDATPAGDPTITIVSPKPGDVVSGEFEVVIETTNFTLSEDLYGKPGVIGYGHWHANLDTASGPMMGMMTMMGMSGTNSFMASTDGLTPGATHKLIAVLVDNGHAPFPTMIADEIEITVG